MPIKGGKMTRKENRFIDEMVKTGDKPYSAHRAGYAQPETAGYIVANKDVIDAAIRQRSAARLNNEGVPIAINVLIDIALDIKQPGNTRVNAADKILKHANAGIEAVGDKEPHEMTADELAKAIEHLNRVKADKARLVIEQDPGLFD